MNNLFKQVVDEILDTSTVPQIEPDFELAQEAIKGKWDFRTTPDLHFVEVTPPIHDIHHFDWSLMWQTAVGTRSGFWSAELKVIRDEDSNLVGYTVVAIERVE